MAICSYVSKSPVNVRVSHVPSGYFRMLLRQLVAAGIIRDHFELHKSSDFSCLRHQQGHYSSDHSRFEGLGVRDNCSSYMTSFEVFKTDDTR